MDIFKIAVPTGTEVGTNTSADGTIPETSEECMILVIKEEREGKQSLTKYVGV